MNATFVWSVVSFPFGCVVNLDAERLSAGDQFCGIAIPEVQRLGARRIDGFHCRERATSRLAFSQLHQNVGVGSALASTWQAGVILLTGEGHFRPERLVPAPELELAELRQLAPSESLFTAASSGQSAQTVTFGTPAF